MIRRSVIGALIAAAVLLGPTPAGAQGEDHNCAGALTSSLAGPGFGAGVSFFAYLQAVDNFGLANCGDAPRQNP
jgi:hypothetical protein